MRSAGAPATTNTMHGATNPAGQTGAKPPPGPNAKVGAWLANRTGAVAPAPDDVGSKPALSAAAQRLLSKTAEQKRASYNSTASKVVAFNGLDVPEGFPARVVDEHVERAHDALKAAKERERLKGAKTKIKFQITAAKHLPKMDRFGKTDCYCVTLLDNKPFGGQRYRRKSKIIKKSLNPEWENEVYVFDVVNFPEQEVKIGVWDWDAGDDDDEIGNCAVSLACIRHQERSEQTLTVLGDDGNPVIGHDGSYSIVKVVVERGTAVDDVKLSMHALVGDAEEVRVLDLSDPPWESAVRGLMFDINNTSPHPVMITGMQACAGRAKGGGSCSYTIYRAPGKWNIGRCPARDHKCFRRCCCLCPCCCCKTCGWHDDHRCMRLCCRCTPCTDTHLGCCCCGECGPAVEKEEPCCDGCKPCCTGNCAICWLGVLFAVPLTFPFGVCCCCGWYVGRAHGGGGGCPALSVQPCCSYECCRNGVHRQADMCEACAPACRGNCTCNATCCYCCRHKFFDRRRWTRVAAGWANLPTDWGELAPLPSLQHFEGGGVLIPPGKTYAFYIHAPHPETKNGEAAIGIRGPHKRGFRQGDVCGADEFIQIRTGPYTMHPLPFPNSDLLNSARDGQYYDLEAEHLKRFTACSFAGKIEYRVLPDDAVPNDWVTECGEYDESCC